jgi:hypothetical protein
VPYQVESGPNGRQLVVTGEWSAEAASVLDRGQADGLILNYSAGFTAPDLDFLTDWPLRYLQVLDRGLSDLRPVERLGRSLEVLYVDVGSDAELNLGVFANLHSVDAEWAVVSASVGEAARLRVLRTWGFDLPDLHALRDIASLERLRVENASRLESLSGLESLGQLASVAILGAPRLGNISAIRHLGRSLRELEFESCRAVERLDDVELLDGLRFLGFSDCGDIESLGPLRSLNALQEIHAWGATRILDDDLSPLISLENLREVRMRDRPGYRPRVKDIAGFLKN